MPASKQDIQRLISYGLPYVFIEKIKLAKGPLKRAEDYTHSDPAYHFVKDRYGTSKVVFGKNVDNKQYFSNDNPYIIELDLFLNEFHPKRVWYGKTSTTGMVVKIIQSTHPEVTRQILKKEITDISALKKEHRIFAQQQILGMPFGKKLADYRVDNLDGIGDVLCSIPLRTTFVANSSHLTYFLFTETARQQRGPRTIERVLHDNRKKTRTSSYYLPNGDVWAGPVHSHEDGWMAGRSHTSRPHPKLRQKRHLNVKLQDYRIFNDLQEVQNSLYS